LQVVNFEPILETNGASARFRAVLDPNDNTMISKSSIQPVRSAGTIDKTHHSMCLTSTRTDDGRCVHRRTSTQPQPAPEGGITFSAACKRPRSATSSNVSAGFQPRKPLR